MLLIWQVSTLPVTRPFVPMKILPMIHYTDDLILDELTIVLNIVPMTVQPII